ncbi:hypothetical protein AQUCO_02000428v1 [Aquilegia coerulea]|uniref:Serine-rich protein-like protein n=1 Tax=Aquilegia coerulea TaxID=218851 RepID=A0A2G5DHI4_AQUCA|nr:hypothetical protein AQUCO_02000428v1 [Aquilegia coerulea]
MAARCSSSSRFMSSATTLLPKGSSERYSSSAFDYSSRVSQRLSCSASSRFSMDQRPVTPCNQAVNKIGNQGLSASQTRRQCMCSPSTHPGAFRCRYHSNRGGTGTVVASSLYSSKAIKLNLQKTSSEELNLQKYAITNSMVHKGAVEGGDSVKKALKDLIRPSTSDPRKIKIHHRPSRLSVTSLV